MTSRRIDAMLCCMRTTMVRWSETDVLALDRVTARLQACAPGRTLSRPEVLKVLVASASTGVPAEELIRQGIRDTIPPTDRGA